MHLDRAHVKGAGRGGGGGVMILSPPDCMILLLITFISVALPSPSLNSDFPSCGCVRVRTRVPCAGARAVLCVYVFQY